MLRVIKDFTPRWVIAENVRGIINIENGMVFQQVCADLESAGYEVQAFIIPAVAVNAPHRRDRVWFVANYRYWNDQRDKIEREYAGEDRQKNAVEPERSIKRDGAGIVADCTSRGLSVARDARGGRNGFTDDNFTAPHTPSDRQQRRGQGVAAEEGLQPRPEHTRELPGRPERPYCDVADTSREGLERLGGEGKGLLGQQDRTQCDKRRNWDENWLEVATELCRVHDGFSDWLDRHINDGVKWATYEQIKKDNWKDLRLLRKNIQASKVREKIGRFFTLDKEEVLLTFLCKLEQEMHKNRLYVKGKKASWQIVQLLREQRKLGRSPQRRRFIEQLAREFRDIVPSMSHEIALEIAENWDCIRFSFTACHRQEQMFNGKKRSAAYFRQEALKAAGNAIVPAVAVEIMKAIKEATYAQMPIP